MNSRLQVACSYQGGKQRIATQIVDILLEAVTKSDTQFYDLCCGSAAISIELVNRGISPSRINMVDISSWGTFWSAIGTGTFNINAFDRYLSELPNDKRDIKAHMSKLAALPVSDNEVELYPLLQACSFGGKQIWRNGNQWANACFRNFWEPTATSIRRSHANPMQPSAVELRRRIHSLMIGMKGVNSLRTDIMEFVKKPLPNNCVVYVDPPYRSTTGYAFNFDINQFINRYKEINQAPLFISEKIPLSNCALMLNFGGAKGGISAIRKVKHQEWLSRF
jgi:16S rRNA G966 N2-methylase RsmD